jgi:uncharacterized protein (TIGR02217 family)
VKFGLRLIEQVDEVVDMFQAIGGAGVGFRIKEFRDFTTAANHRDAPDFDDVVLGTGDASEDEFQLKKLYAFGSFTHTRTIQKPVAGTTVVSLDDTELPANVGGTDYAFSVNTATGVVTITPAPANGLVVKAGCEFDVPATFTQEVDRLLEFVYDGFEAGSLPDILIVELLNPRPLSEQSWPGGSKDHGAISANTSITESQGRLHLASPVTLNGGSPWQLRLPDASSFDGGGPWFSVANDGSQSLAVTDQDGNVLVTVTAGNLAEVWVSVATSGTRTFWAK